MNSSAHIVITNLTKNYTSGDKDLNALNNVNLSLAKGGFVLITGASGSGKSTLLNIIGGLDRPTSGSIMIGDMLLDSKTNTDMLADYRHAQVGFVFQSFHLIPKMTVIENVCFPIQVLAAPTQDQKDYAHQLLEKLSLIQQAKQSIDTLSGGQQQRVAIARALINHPSIVLADEPTGQLDTKNGDQVINLLKSLSKEGITVITVTHNLRYKDRLTQIIKMQDGKVRANIMPGGMH